jgi:hypothetical protein
MVNRKHIYVAFLCILTGLEATAQQARPRLRFHSINQVGILEGSSNGAFQAQTINGVQYKSWFLGVGVGLDDYRYRTIPLFADVRKEFGKSRNRLFVYADAGVHFAHLTNNQKNEFIQGGKFSKGFYGDGGLGYRVGIGRRSAMLISAGYSYEHFRETSPSYVFFPPSYVIIPTPLNYNPYPNDRYDYYLHRLTLKIGLEF